MTASGRETFDALERLIETAMTGPSGSSPRSSAPLKRLPLPVRLPERFRPGLIAGLTLASLGAFCFFVFEEHQGRIADEQRLLAHATSVAANHVATVVGDLEDSLQLIPVSAPALSGRTVRGQMIQTGIALPLAAGIAKGPLSPTIYLYDGAKVRRLDDPFRRIPPGLDRQLAGVLAKAPTEAHARQLEYTPHLETPDYQAVMRNAAFLPDGSLLVWRTADPKSGQMVAARVAPEALSAVALKGTGGIASEVSLIDTRTYRSVATNEATDTIGAGRFDAKPVTDMLGRMMADGDNALVTDRSGLKMGGTLLSAARIGEWPTAIVTATKEPPLAPSVVTAALLALPAVIFVFLLGSILLIRHWLWKKAVIGPKEEAEFLLDRYKAAAGLLGGGIVDWVLSGDRVFLSPEWLALVGFEDEAETDWHVDDWYGHIFEPDRARVSALIQGQIDSDATRFEQNYRLCHRDGFPIDIRERMIVLRDEGGKAQRIVAVHLPASDAAPGEAEGTPGLDGHRSAG